MISMKNLMTIPIHRVIDYMVIEMRTVYVE